MNKSSKTRIQTYFNIGFAVIFFILAFSVISFYYREERKQVLNEAEAKATLLLEHNLSIHYYYTHYLKPSLFAHENIITNPEYFDPTWMSSSYAVRRILENVSSLEDWTYYYKECVVNARNPDNEADEFEKAFLEEVNRDPDLDFRSGIRQIDGSPFFYLLRRGEHIEESCYRCHTDPDHAPGGLIDLYGDVRGFNRSEQTGEVISAVSIRIPLSQAFATVNANAARMALIMGAFFILFYGIQVVFVSRTLFTPIKGIREKMTQIVSGDKYLGERVPDPPGRELKDLVAAFNQMSGKLKEERDMLEQRIEERTRDLTEMTSRLQESLAEKEVLLKEVYHRIKNNLQLVTSMLDIQSAHTDDPHSAEIFQDVKRRVQSIATIHQQLYISESDLTIDFVPYLQGLLEDLARTYEAERKGIILDFDLEDMRFGVEMAVACGLIINELITNAFKYAFAGDREGRIAIRLHKHGESGFILQISDDGIGISADLVPGDLNLTEAGSLGLKLVYSLAEQIGGKVEMTSDMGTSFLITVE